MKWKLGESVPGRPHHYQRADGWSIYLADEHLALWKLCEPDGKERAGPWGLRPEAIDRVLKWADQMIATIQGQH
jgi:hypothetical protein